MAFSDAQTAFNNAATLMAAQNYTAAIDQLMAARAYLAAVPDSTRMGDSLRFRIDQMLDDARERERTLMIRANGGPQRTNIDYHRAHWHTDDE